MGIAACILGCEGTRLSAQEKAFFAQARPWGFILFARNVESPEQLRALVAELRDAVGFEAPVLVDQEGGRVQRLGAPHWRQWIPPLSQVARAGAGAVRSMWLRYRLIAHELRAVGIDANCAPVGDVAYPETHPVLRNRCYGEDAGQVALVARTVAEALMAGGVLPVAKHLPGHGRARTDSHKSLPRVDCSAEELHTTDFAPFAAMSGLPMAMTAHILYTRLDDVPATVSRRMNGVIRKEIGFGGMLMSDDISMQALGGPLGARARAALDAGCDAVLHCTGELREMQEVCDACGPLQGNALRRAEAALEARRAPDPVDIAACEAELSALVPGGACV